MPHVVAPQPRVVVAFHSGYGHTAVLAEAVQHGAEKAGCTRDVRRGGRHHRRAVARAGHG